MTGQGHQIFISGLAGLAASCADQRLQAIAEQVAQPLKVAVCGRRGPGCSTVTRALGQAGLTVATSPDVADVQVYVVAEVLKPEDRDALTSLQDARQPVVVVLNKADLTGFGGAGPLAAAQTRCACFAVLVGLPVEPMVGLLAVAALDDLDEAFWLALRALAAHPDGLPALDGSFDGFLAAELTVPIPMRLRLLEALDLFGIALAVAALRRGGTPAQVRVLLRRVSGVDVVVARVIAAGAEARYQRILDAVTALEAVAVTDERISEFLSCDGTVLARMAVALDTVAASGSEPAGSAGLPSDDPDAHLRRALHWLRYGRAGPSGLQRACGTDIARGSLRLWSRAGGLAESGECG
ncbi:hypothetical protein [Mycobacterium ostraviense]|uniref:Uncharacterized protein n=1 Tax=Mycobacterium ostraviense TaxID=2738409 RepID=A0A163X3C4_9MYCO|nr:hypothetical protein [Mycobacterium ostraviense]KZS58937.1 hypothetical protein A4G28_14755 [Mycobacterium ostraviense]UGT91169.1 hypothetical protein LTS72_23685 [Mycobacterium ostraviense]